MPRSVITARLSQEDIAFLDQLVAAGLVKDRTEGLRASVEAMRRSVRAAREIRIVGDAQSGNQDLYPDLEGLAESASRTPLELD